MSHPLVRARLNERIAGNPHVWPLEWLRNRLRERLPFESGLSVGCGTGALERELIRLGIARRMTGIDSAPQPLRYARDKASEEGLASRIAYEEADAWSFCDGSRQFDAVFFHASLHHFDQPGVFMGRVRRALRPGGIVYMDDFIGPSMKDWSWRKLIVPNLAYYLLPRRLRRPGLVRKPINPQDSTEAVAAGEILPAVLEHFRIVERRDYGGHLLGIIYPNLARPGPDPAAPTAEQLDRAVRFILDVEDWLLAHRRWTRARSFHTVIIAE